MFSMKPNQIFKRNMFDEARFLRHAANLPTRRHNTMSTQFSDAARQQLDLEPALLAELTRALLPYLGPYSITTVKRASRLSQDPNEVILNIASNIEEPGKRELFSKSAKRIRLEYQESNKPVKSTAGVNANASASSGSNGSSNAGKGAPTTGSNAQNESLPQSTTTVRGTAPITPELMQRGEAALAPIIGPLAGVLVQRYARATDNSRDFFERLATHLRTPDERNSFFDSVRSHPSLSQSQASS